MSRDLLFFYVNDCVVKKAKVMARVLCAQKKAMKFEDKIIKRSEERGMREDKLNEMF